MASAILAAAILVVLDGAPEGPPIDSHPRVVSTTPRAGEIVGAGPLTISVTYDRPMRRKSYSFVQKSADSYPDCGANQPAQSADGRTFTMRCSVAPRRRYEVWFNDPPYLNFVSESGQPAVPFGLRFGTR